MEGLHKVHELVETLPLPDRTQVLREELYRQQCLLHRAVIDKMSAITNPQDSEAMREVVELLDLLPRYQRDELTKRFARIMIRVAKSKETLKDR